MELIAVIKETWLTRKPSHYASALTSFLVTLTALAGLAYLADFKDAGEWMAASGNLVFRDHQYWRAWTTLFAHGDLVHLLSNLLLFTPLSYFLIGYFSPWFFPVVGLIVGGLVNLVVLKTLPPEVSLIGISGVVYWMGGAWLTLYLHLNRTDSLRRRLGKVLVILAMLFFPQTFQPEVSYLCHLLGLIAGIVSAHVYYVFAKRRFKSAERIEYKIESFDEFDFLENDPTTFDALDELGSDDSGESKPFRIGNS